MLRNRRRPDKPASASGCRRRRAASRSERAGGRGATHKTRLRAQGPPTELVRCELESERAQRFAPTSQLAAGLLQNWARSASQLANTSELFPRGSPSPLLPQAAVNLRDSGGCGCSCSARIHDVDCYSGCELDSCLTVVCAAKSARRAASQRAACAEMLGAQQRRAVRSNVRICLAVCLCVSVSFAVSRSVCLPVRWPARLARPQLPAAPSRRLRRLNQASEANTQTDPSLAYLQFLYFIRQRYTHLSVHPKTNYTKFYYYHHRFRYN